MRNEPVILVSVIPEGVRATRVELSDRILGFEYEDCENKADKLRLRVDNWDLSNFDDPIWRKGNLVEVSWGYPEAMSPVRRCQIRKVTGFQELSIEAHGLEVILNTQVRNRVFENMSRSAVVRQIAEEWGYREEELLHIEDTEIVRDSIVQARLTDAQFLRRLAHKEGFEWFVDFDGFHFHQRDFTQQSLRVIEWTGADGGEVLAINVENDVTAKPGTVRVQARDPVARRNIDQVASHATETKRGVLGAVVELPSFYKNAQELAKQIEAGDTNALAEAHKFLTSAMKTIAHEEILPATELIEGAAKRLAAGRFRRAQQVAVKLTVEMQGDPNLLAKSVVELRGIGKRLSQRYYVREVKHTIQSGYQISAKMVSDGSGGHSTTSERATEAAAIQVGPSIKGRRAPANQKVPRRSIDADPNVLRSLRKTDKDGQPVQKFTDQRHREPPSKRGA